VNPPILRLVSLVALLSLVFAGGAGATLIALNDPTLAASADGNNLTRDTSTGLEWLDIDISLGRTWDDLVGNDGSNEFAPGGDFEGFRFATLIEFTGQTPGPQLDSLMKSAGLGVPTFSSIGTYAGVHALIGLVGCFANCPTYGYAWGAIEHHTTGLETEIFIENFASSGFSWGRADQGVALTPFATNHPDQGFPLQKGNWLVRPIPEPGSALLLGLGLAGLALRSVRQRRTVA
jgi:hypothetical protein